NSVAFNLNAQGKYVEAEAFWLHAADSFTTVRLQIAAAGLDRATVTGGRSPLPALAAVLARNGKPAAAWQRFDESLARGTGDDLFGWVDSKGQPAAHDPNGEHWAFILRPTGNPVVVGLRGSGANDAWTEADTSLAAEMRAAVQAPHGDLRLLAERLRKQRLDL